MEQYKIIKDFQEYEVSNYGNVRNIKTKEYLEGTLRPNGVYIYFVNGIKWKSKMLHKLVAENFVSNPNNNKFIMHLDKDKSNNHHTNLVYMKDARRVNGSTKIYGEKRKRNSPCKCWIQDILKKEKESVNKLNYFK